MLGGSICEQTPAGELGKQNAYQPGLPAMQHPEHTLNHNEAVGYEIRSSHDGDGLLARAFFFRSVTIASLGTRWSSLPSWASVSRKREEPCVPQAEGGVQIRHPHEPFPTTSMLLNISGVK